MGSNFGKKPSSTEEPQDPIRNSFFHENNDLLLGCPRELGSMVCKLVIAPT